MAEKKTALSIVIRTIDQSTAKIKAINDRLDKLTKPTRDFRKQLGELREKSGLDDVIAGFGGVGNAIGQVIGSITILGAGLIGAGVAVKALIDKFDSTGDLAEQLGVSVDFLSGMRYAAQRSGASLEDLDGGLQTFSENLGQARANTGRMTKFLSAVSPVLLTQLKAAKSTEEGFRLLADAMSKIKDPAKRAAFAQKTVGNSKLAPLLARGSKGIGELQEKFIALAGSQEEAAEAAGKVDDSLQDLGAASLGIQAAIVQGLGPALKDLVDQLQVWLVDHREDIKKWAADIGEKLPAAVNMLVDRIKGVVEDIGKFVDGIGGLKVAAGLAAAVIAGPLVASIIKLGIVLLTTPAGWIITAIGLIALGAYELIKHWDAVSDFFIGLWDTVVDVFWRAVGIIKKAFLEFPFVELIIENWEPISEFFTELWDGITWVFKKSWEIIEKIISKIVGAVETVRDAINFINPFSDDDSIPTVTAARTNNELRAAAGAPSALAGRAQENRLKVDFVNAPPGTRVTADPQSSANVDMTVGYQLIGAAI